ncbi:MAG: hypothetical protein IRZ14_02275 [Chloroflexi bacterium]|nr:hypothetical protein [Chloroflexota bacterium]
MSLWSLLSHSVAHQAGRRRAWVYVDEGGVNGVLVGRVRSHGLVWDVRHLWADNGREEVVAALLQRICDDALQRGARRIFLELPRDAPHLLVARRVGFQQYTEAALLVHPPLDGPSPSSWRPRPRARGDEQALFQLYTAAVPAPARAAEAMTLEEWAALHKGVRRWSPRQLAGRRQFVWDGPEGAVAWLEVAESGRSQHLEWLVHPAYERRCDEVVAGGLSYAQPRLRLYATCRAYQPGLRTALERAGFEPVTECAVLVCQLAVRVPDRALAVAAVRSTIGG